MPNVQYIRFVGGGGSGSTGAHNLLTGLGADDHTQYTHLNKPAAAIQTQLTTVRFGSAFPPPINLRSRANAAILGRQIAWTYELLVGNPIVDVVNSIAETNFFNITLTGDTLQLNAGLLILAWGDYLNNTAAASTLTTRFYFGATAMLTTGAISLAQAVTRRVWGLWVVIGAAGSALEDVWGGVEIGAVASAAAPTVTMAARAFDVTAIAHGTVDHAVDAALRCSVQHGTANAAISARCFGAYFGVLSF